jgi:hypothetical protein
MPTSLHNSFKTRVHELQQQVVRDLAWCCFSTPIMQELPGSTATMLPFIDDQSWDWLVALDRQPDALIAQIAAVKSTRLGIYYETLWRFYFSQQPEWELLHHNLQIERNGITLGAFDFLCRHKDQYWHIETAVKFYLCNTNDAQAALKWSNWIGPGNHDRLDLKLSHLRQHQLPLHQAPDTSAWRTGLCLQGYLFSPAPANYSPKYSPKYSHENHGSGHWWYLRNFLPYLREHADIQWIILERQRWLSPAHSNDKQELAQGENLAGELQKQIGEMKRPLLLAAMTEKKLPNNKGIIWQESFRGFVVPDSWPED